HQLHRCRAQDPVLFVNVHCHQQTYRLGIFKSCAIRRIRRLGICCNTSPVIRSTTWMTGLRVLGSRENTSSPLSPSFPLAFRPCTACTIARFSACASTGSTEPINAGGL